MLSKYISKNKYPFSFDSFFKDFEDFFESGFVQRSLSDGYAVNVAGYSKGDINVTQEGEYVNIIAENKKFGKKSYQFYLPSGYDIKSVKYHEGILEFTFDGQSKKSKKIEIS